VIYDQEAGGQDWIFQRDDAEIAVALKGRLRVSAAEGVRAAILAHAGIAVASEWMFSPEIADRTVQMVLFLSTIDHQVDPLSLTRAAIQGSFASSTAGPSRFPATMGAACSIQ
jgi:DNA-binding transcriptional LysR family regulator